MAKSYVAEANGDQRRRGPERASFDLSEYVLTQIALSFMTSNAQVTHRFKSKMLSFLEYCDEEHYADRPDVRWRLALARSIGRAVLKSGAKAFTAVEHRVLEDTEWAEWHAAFFQAYRNGTGHAVDGDVLENELSDEDVRFVDGYVSTRLRYSYLWQYRNVFQEIATSVATGDMGDIEVFNEQAMTVLERIVERGRRVKAISAAEGQDFHTGDVAFEAAIRATHTARNRPQSMVKTGLRLLNDMLGGGYEGGRVYVHFGRSGDWKSGMLCSVAFWACDPRFNPSFRTKDPTRKPCVLMVSQENDMFETIERMISFGLSSSIDLRGFNEDDIVRMMGEAFSSESCHFSFKYRASRSISTADLEAMIHEEYLQGYEVVMIVQDYIKRITAVEQFRDQRHLELGAIVDEFSGIAKRHGIPVVTGMQLNRQAYAKFDAAIKSGRSDAVKELGAAEAGESINVYENADVVIFQGRVTSEALDGRMFQTFRRGKFRGRTKGGPDFFAQPFELDENGITNEMRLTDDAHLSAQQCKGMKDVGDGLAQLYNPNGDEPGGTSTEERRAGRMAATLGGGSQPTRTRAPAPRQAAPARALPPPDAPGTVVARAEIPDL